MIARRRILRRALKEIRRTRRPPSSCRRAWNSRLSARRPSALPVSTGAGSLPRRIDFCGEEKGRAAGQESAWCEMKLGEVDSSFFVVVGGGVDDVDRLTTAPTRRTSPGRHRHDLRLKHPPTTLCRTHFAIFFVLYTYAFDVGAHSSCTANFLTYVNMGIEPNSNRTHSTRICGETAR